MAKPIIVKRYARERLYSEGRYVIVEDLRSWQAEGLDFAVVGAETVKDITRFLLA